MRKGADFSIPGEPVPSPHRHPVLPPNPAWQDQGNCTTADPAIFHPDNSGVARWSTAKAKAVCATCPVIEQCRDFALEMHVGDIYGVWGGMCADELMDLRIERRRQSA